MPWRADEGVAVRSPLLPIETFAAWHDAADPRAFLTGLLAQPAIDEALFVASPSLHGAIAGYLAKPDSAANKRVERSLAKYVARMAARATPFGLFSAISTGRLGAATSLELAPRGEYRRRTRLDNDYLYVLAGQLAIAHAAQVPVRPNSSLYRVAGRLRYAATSLAGKERRYHLVSAEPTPYLEATLARAAGGALPSALADALVDAEISREEAAAYVDEVIAAQLLVPDLGVAVTGDEPIDGMIAQLRATGLDAPAGALASARAAIAELDARGLANEPAAYRAIATGLEPLGAAIDLARLFQVDMVKPAAITVGKKIAADVLHALTQVGRCTPARTTTFDDFRRAFVERWEGREIPLAEVLDEESGIGFEASRAPGSEGAPLLAGIGFPGQPADPQIGWRARDQHLIRRLAAAPGARELVVTDADFDAMAVPESVRLPDAFSAVTRLARDPEEILVEGCGGPSGARTLGRFCHASRELEAMVRAHLAREEAQQPDALFAEIVHLNEGRIGNILCRPVLRGHEVVFLGISGAPREQQITLDDLLVSVRGDRVVLRSRRLGKEIVPRLTTAHNYRLRSLGVYRFLCALADQSGSGTGWQWGPAGEAPHLPRVRYGRVILARETWNLHKHELKKPLSIAALREARQLPRFVALADGDNELPIDLDNPLLADVLADELEGRGSARLVELFPDPSRAPVHGPEGSFLNEVVLTFSRSDRPPAEARGPTPEAPAARRSFGPGSEWLYAKIYGGESMADLVLREAIAPVVKQHGGRWFFLRYRDTESHLRVRFRGEPARLLGETLPALHDALAPLIASGVARRLVLDTYDRELERYGDTAIDTVEDIFWRDSEAVLGIVELLEGDAGADARWRLAVRGIESLLAAIGLAREDRAKVSTFGRDMLGREMRADTALWGRIGDRFAVERASLEHLFEPDPARDAAHDLEPGLALLAARDAHIRALDLSKVPVGEVAWSLAHMHANRLLHASQRAQELVLYDFLRRLHAASRHRQVRPAP